MIDDSKTMDKHWKAVKELAMLLTWLVKGTDDDGVDLFFLSSPKRHKCKTSTKMYQYINDHKARTSTNLDARLNDDLEEYAKRLENPSRRQGGVLNMLHSSASRDGPKKRSLYIFTDGILETGQETQGHHAIQMIVKKLLSMGRSKGRLGIQLISFGNNEAGLNRLKNLDTLSLGL